MIDELRIRALGVIDEAVVPFARGFTVLSGETGAGKTMVLTGLGLIMGDKADAGLVRRGSDRAEVDAEWRLPADGSDDVLAVLDEAGVACEREDDEHVLLLGRTVASGGRSRAVAGGRSVPAGVLADVTERLIAVHGQSDQLLLRDPRRQRALLDLYAGPAHAATLASYAEAFAAWRAAQGELRSLVDHRREIAREAALLRLGIEEISAVQPVPGEDDALKGQAGVLAHATDLLDAVGLAHAALVGGDDDPSSMVELLGRAHRAVERARELDPALGPVLERLDRLSEDLSVAAGELAQYAREVDADPARQAEVEDRRQALSALKRKYGPTLDDVLAWWSTAEETVVAADGADERLAMLTETVERLRDAVVGHARSLTAGRRAAGGTFAREVTDELHELAMPHAAVTVEVRTADDPDDFTADGADAVAMLLTPHPGSDPRPLGTGASGGELSRVMLAIEVVLAGVNRVPTFVFDEVDAGIGGRVAVEVGRRLARLARTSQVIVVTHLPQVAAFADQHVVVAKDSAGQVTASSVTVVDGAERVRELVRMLSGLEDSASGAEHAAELLALAERDRSLT